MSSNLSFEHKNGNHKGRPKPQEKETATYDGSWFLNHALWHDWNNSESLVLGTYHRRLLSHHDLEPCWLALVTRNRSPENK